MKKESMYIRGWLGGRGERIFREKKEEKSEGKGFKGKKKTGSFPPPPPPPYIIFN